MINQEKLKEQRGFWQEYGLLTLYITAFFVLLLARDAYSVSVNKYILLALACLSVVTLSTDKLIGLFCFLFPLYVGLPGNYMTLLLIVRLLVDINNIRFKVTSLLLTACVCLFVFVQNVILGYTGIVYMVYIAGILLILLMFSYRGRLSRVMLITAFSAGVAALGFIMLTATLQVYEISELMSSFQRLGAEATNYAAAGIMNVSIDPNFYGTFVIAAVSTAFPLIADKQVTRSTRIFLIVMSVVSVVVCIVGLSRAAVLMLAVWVVMYILFQRGAKMAWLILALAAVILVAMPDVVDALFVRFEEGDMATGNGRTGLIERFYGKWTETPVTLLVGVGLFNCNVHCTPLQFLFGGGILLFVLLLMLVISYIPKSTGSFKLSESLSFWITLGMMLTVPAAGLLNFMFPLVYTGLVLVTKEKGYEKA